MYIDIPTESLKRKNRTVITEIGDSNKIIPTRKLRPYTKTKTNAATTKKTEKSEQKRDQ